MFQWWPAKFHNAINPMNEERLDHFICANLANKRWTARKIFSQQLTINVAIKRWFTPLMQALVHRRRKYIANGRDYAQNSVLLLKNCSIQRCFCYSNQKYLPTESSKILRHHNISQPSQSKYLESNNCIFAIFKILKKKRFFPFTIAR